MLIEIDSAINSINSITIHTICELYAENVIRIFNCFLKKRKKKKLVLADEKKVWSICIPLWCCV